MAKDDLVLNAPVYIGQNENGIIFVQMDEKGNHVARYTVEDNIIKKIEWLYCDEWRGKNWLSVANREKIFVLPVLGNGVLISDGAMGDIQDATIINLNDELRLERGFMKRGGIVKLVTNNENDLLLSEEVLIDGTIDNYECWKVFYVGQGLEPDSIKQSDGMQEMVYGKVKDNDSSNMVARGENPNSGIRVILDKSRTIEIDSKTAHINLVDVQSQM